MHALLEHRALAAVLAAAGLVVALLLGVVVTFVVRRTLLEMPAEMDAPYPVSSSRPRRILRTLAGVAVFLAGALLLVLPGPGLLLMALGLLMLGPRWHGRVVRACLARPRLLRAVNTLRARHGRRALSVSVRD